MPMLDSAKLATRRPMAASPPDPSVTRVLQYAFAPVHKLALGLAFGLTAGLAIFAVTAFHVVAQPEDGLSIGLLGQYFYGYDVTWRGAFVGLWWGFVAGFSAGWFLAFLRNLAVAIWIFVIRTKASLAQSKDFLDHI